ncbi:hypothetical protein BKA70DRAFT_1216092 [Coprinopsis sp. MPI-PUGE-AT-0042]|nr:hypothetical protein BKA70DRAFT_1216092 [Coprinopsis sp. MPI-PUGE-AT-0042]
MKAFLKRGSSEHGKVVAGPSPCSLRALHGFSGIPTPIKNEERKVRTKKMAKNYYFDPDTPSPWFEQVKSCLPSLRKVTGYVGVSKPRKPQALLRAVAGITLLLGLFLVVTNIQRIKIYVALRLDSPPTTEQDELARVGWELTITGTPVPFNSSALPGVLNILSATSRGKSHYPSVINSHR